MTKNIFFCSDHHFNHSNILTFRDYEGQLLREGFSDVNEMNEHLIAKHNSVVNPGDTVYFVGDVSMNVQGIKLVGRMNGRKILVRGNHDIFKLKDYVGVFEDIRGYKIFPKEGLITSHIPIHPASFHSGGRWVGNIHGHLHANLVREPTLVSVGGLCFEMGYTHTNPQDKRYYNVSVERIDYTPVDFETIKEYFVKLKSN